MHFRLPIEVPTSRVQREKFHGIVATYMKVLILAPQPFFQERGTPIAVRMLVEALSEAYPQAELHLLTYHDGADVDLGNVKHHRMWAPQWLGPVKPGASLKKFVADGFFFLHALRLALRARPSLIHAVEEAGFIAWLFRVVLGIPYVYDMDSLLSSQLIERWPAIEPLRRIFRWFESLVVRSASTVVAVCPALVEEALSLGARRVELLTDVALALDGGESTAKNLRVEFGIADEQPVSLYVGNLEHYQGLDLALESFALVLQQVPTARFLIVGGSATDIVRYSDRAKGLGISQEVIFVGPRPLKSLQAILRSGDLLLSPRLKGINTPMKLYSYLASGVPVLATRLLTHTQVLDEQISRLAEPTVQSFSQNWVELLLEADVRRQLADAAVQRVEERYSMPNFKQRVGDIFKPFFSHSGASQAAAARPLASTSPESKGA